MEYYERIIKLSEINRKSLFLFGPRQTGKSMLLKKLFPEAPYYNLLLSTQFLKLSQAPSILREELLAQYPEALKHPIIIDEIQMLPALLNEVHALIEEFGFRFILTGSSARKLKRGAANLLGGRALEKFLFPLVSAEIPNYDLKKIINYGLIPSIYNSLDPQEDLYSYIGTYLKEEVQAEGLIRGVENFSLFLEKAGLINGELINFANISNDLGVSAKTVKEYFLILQDTLIGSLLLPFKETTKRKAISTAKFYFFDVGVANTLAHRKLVENKSELFGKCLEHFIFTELRAYLSYSKDRRVLSFWRSTNGQEVDFLIGNEIAIEVKASDRISEKHLKGLIALNEEVPLKTKIIISQDSAPRLLKGDIWVYPVKDFLHKLWNNEI